jgi:hypothetical protein
MLGGVCTDMTDEDDEQMRIVFEAVRPKNAPRPISGRSAPWPCFIPRQRIPKHLKRVSDNPPAWANLVVVRCSLIVPDHYVMTDAGLKRVVSVQR